MLVRALQDCFVGNASRNAGDVFEYDRTTLTPGVLVPVNPAEAAPPPPSVPMRNFTPPPTDDGADLLS